MSSPDRLRELTQEPAPDLVQVRTSPLDVVASTWTRRRLLIALGLWPVVLATLWLTGSSPSALLLGGASLALALTLVTYLPGRGQTVGQVIGAPCGIVGLALAVLGAAAISDGPAGPGLGWGVVMVVAGLAHRVVTGGSCGTPVR